MNKRAAFLTFIVLLVWFALGYFLGGATFDTFGRNWVFQLLSTLAGLLQIALIVMGVMVVFGMYLFFKLGSDYSEEPISDD